MHTHTSPIAVPGLELLGTINMTFTVISLIAIEDTVIQEVWPLGLYRLLLVISASSFTAL